MLGRALTAEAYIRDIITKYKIHMNMNKPMKFCKDCKYAKVGFWNRIFIGYKYAECTHSSSEFPTTPNIVSGSIPKPHWHFCSTQRDYDCGHDGIFWEAKKKEKVVYAPLGPARQENIIGKIPPEPNIVKLTSLQLVQADSHLLEANKLLKRRYPTSHEYMNNLLRRNYYQIKDTDRIYAVAAMGHYDDMVVGGTGWAVAMAMQRPVDEIYLFDQNVGQWYQWRVTWQKVSRVPRPHGKYTGIGSRELNDVGKQAIIDLYA